MNKIFISLILFFVVSAIFLSGCVSTTDDDNNLGTTQSELNSDGTANSPNNGGPSEVDNVIYIPGNNNPAEPDPKPKDEVDPADDNPSTTPQILLNALGLAQLLGLPTDDIDAATKAKIKQYIEQIIADPNSTNAMLVNALELAQALGLDSEGMFAKEIWDKIKSRIEAELNDPYTCKNRLKEIAELLSQLGWDDLADKAMQKAESATELCSRIKYEYLSEAKDTYYFTKIDIVGGALKRYSVLGQTLGTRNYYFEDGKFIWSYKVVVDNGCVIITKEGNGTATMDSENHSLFGFEDAEQYGGSAFFSVELNVDKTPSPTRNEYCDENPDQQLGKSKEYENLQVHIGGNAKGHRAVGQKNQVWSPPQDQESGYEYTYWDLSFGE